MPSQQTVINGPFLMSSGGVTTIPSFTITKWHGSVYRKKPLAALIANMTVHLREKSVLKVGMQSSGSYFGPISPRAGYFSPDNGLLTQARREALYRCREKIKDEDWNLSTFVAEFPSTLKFFGDTLKEIVHLYREVRRGNMTLIRRMAKRAKRNWSRVVNKIRRTIAERWLAWRYAVTPLVMDCDAAIKAFVKKNQVRLLTRKAVGGAKVDDLRQYRGATPGSEWTTWEDKHLLTHGAYVQANQNTEAMKRLGLINFLVPLWELTPFSFIVDWFIPIGRQLGNLDALLGVTVISTWSATKRNARMHRSFNALPGWYLGSSEWSSETYSRAKASLELPRIKLDISLNTRRFFDALALTTNSLKAFR